MQIDNSMLFRISMIFDFYAKAILLQLSVMQGMILSFLKRCKSASSLLDIKFKIPERDASMDL